MDLLKGAKRLQNNPVFMNKIKERSNIAFFKPNETIELGALFITICSRYINKNKELQIILTIPDFSRGISNIKYQLRGVLLLLLLFRKFNYRLSSFIVKPLPTVMKRI